MEQEIYEVRVLPFVLEAEKMVNGKKYIERIDNLNNEEIKNMSCEPRMFWQRSNRTYMAEMPLTYKGGTSIKWSLLYVFEELTKEEQEKYFDRSITIYTTEKDVVKVYGESSKKFFGRIKTKKKI